ncbi:MAG: ribosome biogenesis GTPase Der [Chthonomonadales bacterium]|nr:ribosome biogenesis GTPase Der [Chthonomonadales bacterium]
MSSPLVAVVGRPNVGKSTLFNRLAGKRIAIVEDTPGITRDRLYAPCEWAGRHFTLIDTGGIVLDEHDPIVMQVRRQAEIAMDEADAILLVCDTPEGLLDADRDLADVLRRSPAPVFVVANKVDTRRADADAMEFHSLGLGPVYTVSAVHGHGLADLLDDLIKVLPVDEQGEEDESTTRLALIGRPNVGKSSLTNAILGEERVIVSPVPGTTRDAIDTALERDGQSILMIDTAGIRRAGKIQGSIEYYTVLRAKTAIERCHVGIVVVDAHAGLLDGDKRVAGMAHEAGRGCVIAVNKWDLVDPAMHAGRPTRSLIAQFTADFRKQVPFLQYAPLVFCSAVTGMGVTDLLDTALSAAANHAHRIPTGELNRLIRAAVDARPRTQHGRQLKVYYATMPRVQPPTILLFVNDPDMLHFSYQRYLENRIRESYPLEGTPIVIRARTAENGSS